MNKRLLLRYRSPAEDTNEGWEKYSLPIGNGYGGASIFGGVEKERIQFTTNVFANTFDNGGVSNFAEIHIFSAGDNIQGYERGLDFSTGSVYSHYCLGEKKIAREAFFNYPDNVFAYKIQVKNGQENFQIHLVIPYLGARSVENGGRVGCITAKENSLMMQGELPARNLLFSGICTIESDGIVTLKNESIVVKNATSVILYFAFGTSYKLCPEVFFDGCHKALGEDPYEKTQRLVNAAKTLGYEKLRARHISDYSALMGRVSLHLGGVEDARTTEELLQSVQSGNREVNLEELYFTFGRHLLVSSSRKGTPPASLQGVWSVHDRSPWGSGFWHNINIQMNYWPAFTCNLAETFLAYAEYFNAYLPQAKRNARAWLSQKKGIDVGEDCGWIIGTAAFSYEIEGLEQNTHSGPGTGGLTAKMFFDYYDFTRDKETLEKYVFPAVHGISTFLTKCVKNYHGEYLCCFSASPEQILSGEWVHEHSEQQYYHTVGCAFDQQMIYENALDDLVCAQIIGVQDDTVKAEKSQFNAYMPVRIGYSGQIKEYGEEHFYGEIGEAKHRHISQLVGLMPGHTITKDTPAWLDSAKTTLRLRGDKSTGWALAHRMCAWARTGDGDHAYLLFRELLKNRTYPNLWDVHPPFQIDGNFGATAGIAEMLLQSHSGTIELFPAIPKEWDNISFSGLKARGNYTVSASFKQGTIECEIFSVCGGEVCVSVEMGNCIKVVKEQKDVLWKQYDGKIVFQTERGGVYRIFGITKRERDKKIPTLQADWTEHGVHLSWKGNAKRYLILRAVGDDSDYTELAVINENAFIDKMYNEQKKTRISYKVIPFDGEKPKKSECGGLAYLHAADELEMERYKLRFQVNNLNIRE